MAHAEVILKEDIYKLGYMGDIVKVKMGYARNYLIPQGKALRANANNKKLFEAQKVELAERASKIKQEAEKTAHKLSDKVFTIIEQASESGVLYGAISAVYAGKFLQEKGYNIAKDAVQIVKPIKSLGLHIVDVVLHADIKCQITFNIAVSEESASEQLNDAKKQRSLEQQSSDIQEPEETE